MALRRYQEQAILESVGDFGRVIITGTSAITPPTGYVIKYIVPSSDIVISAYTNSADYVEQGDLTSIASHPTGVPIYGEFTSITLTSGDGIGYLSKE